MTTRSFVVLWESGATKLQVAPTDAESEEWAARKEVTDTFAAVFRDMKASCPLVTRDPLPGEPPLPAGMMSPSLLASVLLARLGERFPEETLSIVAENTVTDEEKDLPEEILSELEAVESIVENLDIRDRTKEVLRGMFEGVRKKN